MRCYCCDVELSDYECTLRGSVSNQYLDMCMECITASGISAVSYTNTVSNPYVEEETWNNDD